MVAVERVIVTSQGLRGCSNLWRGVASAQIARTTISAGSGGRSRTAELYAVRASPPGMTLGAARSDRAHAPDGSTMPAAASALSLFGGPADNRHPRRNRHRYPILYPVHHATIPERRAIAALNRIANPSFADWATRHLKRGPQIPLPGRGSERKGNTRPRRTTVLSDNNSRTHPIPGPTVPRLPIVASNRDAKIDDCGQPRVLRGRATQSPVSRFRKSLNAMRRPQTDEERQPRADVTGFVIDGRVMSSVRFRD